MNELDQYLNSIKNEKHRQCLKDVINWVTITFPDLDFKIAWNQPMFTHHDTFIIGFSASAKHFSIAPEAHTISVFEDKIKACGYTYGSNIFRIKWDEDIQYSLIEEIICFNIEEKKDCLTFWRK